jgi:predicted porin
MHVQYRLAAAGAALLCALAALSGAVQAQENGATSTVQVYGIISTGPQYISDAGGDHKWVLANAGMMPPRLGFRGDENLGGGNHAIFTLENGFNIKNGAQLGPLFGRQAFVGLKNDSYGTLTMGRQYDEMTSQLYWANSSSNFSGIGAHIGDNDNMFLTNRINNSVRYASPRLDGLSFAVIYGLSEAADSSNNYAFSGGVNYATGKLKLGAAYSRFNRHSDAIPSNVTGGAIDSTSWGFSSPFVTSQGGKGTDSQRIAGVGATYDFGFMNVLANASDVEFHYSDMSGLSLRNVEVGAWTNFTRAWTVGVAFIRTTGEYSSGARPRWNQFDFGTLYALSKRTDLFWTAIHQRAGGDAQYAWIYSVPRAAGKTQTVTQVGMRHRF